MGISCGASLIKWILFLFNLIWFALGAVMLYFGFYIVINMGKSFKEIFENYGGIFSGPILLIILGFSIFIIGFLGCCGAVRESYCMLATYGWIILALLILECVGAGLAFHYKTDIRGEIDKNVQKFWDKNINQEDTRKAIYEVQKELKCCGLKDYNDWTRRGLSIPGSCCDKGNDSGCSQQEVRDVPGCVDRFEKLIEKTFNGLFGAAIAAVLVQLIIVLSACCLAKEVRD